MRQYAGNFYWHSPPEAYKHAEPQIKRAIKGERVTFETTSKVKNEETVNLLLNYIPDFDKTGELVGYFNIVLDVSQIKKAEKKLLEEKNKFEQLVKLELPR